MARGPYIPDEDLIDQTPGALPTDQQVGANRPNQPKAVYSPAEIAAAARRAGLQAQQDAKLAADTAAGRDALARNTPGGLDLTPRLGPHIPTSAPGLPLQDPWQAPDLYAGMNKLAKILAQSPTFGGRKYSHDWDQWLLSVPFNASDPDYNQALANERAAAIQRESSRGNDMGRVYADGKGPRYDTAAQARIKAAGGAEQRDQADIKGLKRQAHEGEVRRKWQDMPSVINAFLEEMPRREALAAPGGLTPPGGLATGGTQADALADDKVDNLGAGGNADKGKDKNAVQHTRDWTIATDSTTSKQLERSGKVVWMGKTTVQRGGVDVQVDTYMTANDATNIPSHWTAGQVANFQYQVGNKITGVMDDASRADWKKIVETSNYYTMNGIRVDPLMVVTAVAGSKGGGGGGGGGRGGGGGGALVPADQAKFLLNQTMQKYVGREATDAEFGSFLGQIKGAAGSADFDAQQYAIDWVKNRAPQETGSYQAATQYYDVIRQVIGGG